MGSFNRKSIRLKDYDYSQAGYYFVTVCTKDKKSLFWEVGATCGRQFERPPLSNIGKINEKEYQEIWKYIEINPLKWEEDKYYI